MRPDQLVTRFKKGESRQEHSSDRTILQFPVP